MNILKLLNIIQICTVMSASKVRHGLCSVQGKSFGFPRQKLGFNPRSVYIGRGAGFSSSTSVFPCQLPFYQ